MDASAGTHGVRLDRLVSDQGTERVDEVTAFTGKPRTLQSFVEIPAAASRRPALTK